MTVDNVSTGDRFHDAEGKEWTVIDFRETRSLVHGTVIRLNALVKCETAEGIFYNEVTLSQVKRTRII